MKLRIQGNSIRLRLSREEVDTFGREGTVSDLTAFPIQTLTFGLQRSSQLEQVQATYVGREIWIHVPTNVADAWTQTQEVGFSVEQLLPSGEKLAVKVEKDFQCLHREGVDESGLYPHPEAKNFPKPKA